ncbi:Transposase [Fusarium oxysporum f. sp. albedinis]|nr:Transposase [Fusarium oxysporum f. sp. albedinis]
MVDRALDQGDGKLLTSRNPVDINPTLWDSGSLLQPSSKSLKSLRLLPKRSLARYPSSSSSRTRKKSLLELITRETMFALYILEQGSIHTSS